MDEQDLDPNPIVALAAWLDEARGVTPHADTMTLATATPDGRPSARVVLVRGVDERGIDFFTNRMSRKCEELRENPRAALVLHWWELGRQARVEGTVEELGSRECEAYWRTRPRASQLAAWASRQSQELASREELDDAFAREEARFANTDVPLPPYWGGYRVHPESIEFWTHRDDRLHDRIRYERTISGWTRVRLAP
ncbi:MAG TPA: pyridoxamine 5'-phosphate oxidase [Gaiellaceae bacterium]|nr:pyridoxamine 5'-phosphate oxidase [Gaiellaceae bacterium]